MQFLEKIWKRLEKMENSVEKTHGKLFCLSGKNVLKPSILTYFFF